VLELHLHAQPHGIDAGWRRLVRALVDRELRPCFFVVLAVDNDAAETAYVTNAYFDRRTGTSAADAGNCFATPAASVLANAISSNVATQRWTRFIARPQSVSWADSVPPARWLRIKIGAKPHAHRLVY